MKRLLILTIVVLMLTYDADGQAVLTLQDCHERAESNYPLSRQRQLVEKTGAYSVLNASKAFLPGISLGGQATYQSEVTRIPIEMPGIEPLSKDQYRIFGEISQTLYHGGTASFRQQLEESGAETEEQKLETDLYQLKSRINELFFGILLLQEQIVQTGLIRDDLQANLREVEAAIANGTVLRSASSIVKAEILHLDQRIIEMESTVEAYRHILGLFINGTVEKGTILEKPTFTERTSEINRAELKLFELQKRGLTISESLVSATGKPRVELFVQGGYGRPGLNMLENDFSLYYLGGIRFSWLLSGYYTLKNERQILELRRQALEVQKETFLFNTKLTLTQHDADIRRLQRLIEVDDKIISLRTGVRQTAEVQLQEGVITSTDFVREVNAEDQAKQNRVLHEIQLLLAQAKYHFTSGQ